MVSSCSHQTTPGSVSRSDPHYVPYHKRETGLSTTCPSVKCRPGKREHTYILVQALMNIQIVLYLIS